MASHPQVQARAVKVWDPTPLEDWIARETKLGNSTLEREVQAGNQALATVLAWSLEVNEAIEDLVFGVPPFPLFRESLIAMNVKADVIVVSQTPTEALVREWAEHHLDRQVRFIAGQELGTKTEHIRFAAAGKYAPDKMLMIGDAPGDHKAAKSNGALFFPINPGDEERSWAKFQGEALERFFDGTFAGAYEEQLLREFDSRLPESPPWVR